MILVVNAKVVLSIQLIRSINLENLTNSYRLNYISIEIISL